MIFAYIPLSMSFYIPLSIWFDSACGDCGLFSNSCNLSILGGIAGIARFELPYDRPATIQPILASFDKTWVFEVTARSDTRFLLSANVLNAVSSRPSLRRSIASLTATVKCSMTLESR